MEGLLCRENLSQNVRRLWRAAGKALLVLHVPCCPPWLLTGLQTQGDCHFLSTSGADQIVAFNVLRALSGPGLFVEAKTPRDVHRGHSHSFWATFPCDESD